MLQKFWNNMNYGCSSKADFDLVKEQRDQFNHKLWLILSGICTIYFLILSISTLSIEIVKDNLIVYAVMVCFSIASLCLLRYVLKPGDRAVLPLIYLYSTLLMIFGVFIGVPFAPQFLAVTYHVLIIVLPLLVVDRPYRIAMLEAVMSVFFVVSCHLIKTGETRSLDIFNCVFFAVLGQIVNYFMAGSKMSQFLVAKQMELASITDGMTGLLNRKAYEAYLRELETNGRPQDLVYLAMDANGLKMTNDTIGHSAGDELIRATAECIRHSFDICGRSFRVGGDEFVVVVSADERKLAELMQDFRKASADWKGQEVDKLSVSVGIASCREFPGLPLTELAKVADRRMYVDKDEYYRVSGLDRRKSR